MAPMHEVEAATLRCGDGSSIVARCWEDKQVDRVFVSVVNQRDNGPGLTPEIESQLQDAIKTFQVQFKA